MTGGAATNLEWIATGCFVLAVIHTFATTKFARLAHRYPPGSVGENFFHFLSEVEVVFGFWAFIFIVVLSCLQSTEQAVHYLEGVRFTEAVFVFAVMAMASTRPVMEAASLLIGALARLVPNVSVSVAWYGICLSVGPLLGSLITEPAAMTVTVLLLAALVFQTSASARLRYSTLAVLFVNVSIGGTLTHFAAPPIVMVAKAWGWDISYMLAHFGWKAVIAVCINTLAVTFWNRRELNRTPFTVGVKRSVPLWVTLIQCLFLAFVVRYHESMAFFVPLFLLFVGWHEVTNEFQEPLKLREALLVGFFLGGLVTLGKMQSWWIIPIVEGLSPGQLFIGATGLTAITDNAALTYLGTLVPDLPDIAKYALTAGAVAGGGLTVIANAPNPIGLGLVKKSFAEHSVSPGTLFLYAIVPTVVACLTLWFL